MFVDARKGPHEKRFERLPAMQGRTPSPPNFKRGKQRDNLFPATRENMPSYDVNKDVIMPSLTTGSKIC